MVTINQLVRDLQKLNRNYSELSNSRGELFTKKDVERYQRGLIEAGKLFVDFYNNSFVPNYSKISSPVVKEVSKELQGFAYMASNCLEKRNYFGLSVLLTPRGTRIGDPNSLNIIIKKLKKCKK